LIAGFLSGEIEEKPAIGDFMAQRRYTSQFLYQFEAMPVLISCNFVVDSTNGNGLGIRSLKGAGVAAVYMNTSATPATGNPNPAAGNIIVQLTDVYKRYLGGFSGQVSPVGTPVTATTSGAPAVIISLGTATLAQWQAVGLPKGIVPQVGLSFVPTSSATIGGSATVAPAATNGSGIDHIEVVGDANLTVSSLLTLPAAQIQPIGQQSGGYLVLRTMLNNVTATPANGSAIALSMYLSNSSVTLSGQ
jgi:hypothetical protein